ACLINLSRGFVVDHEALARHLRSGKLGGAAVDVFPQEPETGGAFSSPLRGLDNAILTPHVGGSTEEAQQNIGQFVSAKMIDYFKSGNSLLSGNCWILAGRWDTRFTTSIAIARSRCWPSCAPFHIRFGCVCRAFAGSLRQRNNSQKMTAICELPSVRFWGPQAATHLAQ